MRTLRAAAQLLADAATLDALGSIASAIGCAGNIGPLDAALLREIGIDARSSARIADGPGALRALLISFEGREPLRDLLTRTAARLRSRTPHILWLVLATQSQTSAAAVATWQTGERSPRIAALLVDRSRVLDSDAETLAALIAARDERPDADVLTHARWFEILGRESLTRRFYRELEVRVEALAVSLDRGSTEERRDVALLYSSRLLFLSFLEAKGWLDRDRAFLSHAFDACMERGGAFHRRVLLPLFFGTLNTRIARRAPAARALGRIPFLNGGLFARTPNERRLRGIYFPDEELGRLFGGVFARYRFTAREESADWTESAVDPEMLGKAFESLMVSRDRKGSGSFYTPYALVARLTDAALRRIDVGAPLTCVAASAAEANTANRCALVASVDRLTILDPACGSGAFLVHALERVADLRRAAGDARAVPDVRRDVLTRSIFGVDKNPTAVWLCQLRLWLSIVIDSELDDPLAVQPLPNLDRNIRAGDSLSADGSDGVTVVHHAGEALRRLRQRYARASGPRKESLVRLLDREERRIAVTGIDQALTAIAAQRRDLLVSLRGRDLFGARTEPAADARRHATTLRARAATLRAERRRLSSGGALPFCFEVHFADVLAHGGFDIVLGNPPWVRLHRIAPVERERFRRQYRVFRAGGWESGAERAHAGRGFAAQVDLAALFIERSMRLLRPGGVLSLLVPSKLWQSLAGGGVRRLLVEESRLVELEDLAEAPALFDAATYPSLVVAERWNGTSNDTPGELLAATHRSGCAALRWRLPRRMLPFDDSPGSPWLILPPEVRTAFDRMRKAGVPLADSRIGRPHLGVKTGFNLAFVVTSGDMLEADRVGVVAANGRSGCVEHALLRPVLRGEDIRAWGVSKHNEYILWTHGRNGFPLERLPRGANQWLRSWRSELATRTDGRGACWWSLFRVDGARTDRPRVVWPDLGRTPRAAVLLAGDTSVPLNSCYVALCRDEDDAFALAAILNSPLASAWLATLAEPARGGYRRFLGWTMSLFPLPADWDAARALLAPLARSAMARAHREVELRDLLLQGALAAYGLEHDDVAPLLAWFNG